ncbi:MAG: radical SAM protein [Carboxydocellales bacterium]
MILAKNNIIVKIAPSIKEKDRDEYKDDYDYAILNPVSGSFDIMDKNEYAMLKNLANASKPDDDFIAYLLERGYAYKDHNAEKATITQAQSRFEIEVNNSQIQLLLIPTYGCNLACGYCFQQGIADKSALVTKETVDAFFAYIRKNFAALGKQKPFITLFGGEPLINSRAQRKIISYIIDRCAAEDYELAVVTNGYDLIDYVEILKKFKIKEIQVTLDGSRFVHDTRRAKANKEGTFDRIVSGVEAAIKQKMPINLRSVVDLENITDLVNLAEFLEEKGWLSLPPQLFKTQIGRNYELIDCYAKPQHLMTQIELWGQYASLCKQHPVLTKFHRPDFKGIRKLVDTGEMYMASFDTCPACKTEWVFDLHGKIYGCTASCGREEYPLGTYWPEVNLNQASIQTWQNRDVTTIPKCIDCKYDVICGGGCGVVAANKNKGEILAPDCRPIQELIEIGVNYYFEDIKGMTAQVEQKNPANGSSCCNHATGPTQ